MRHKLIFPFLLIFASLACNFSFTAVPQSSAETPPTTNTAVPPPVVTPTLSVPGTAPTSSGMFTAAPPASETRLPPSGTALPTVESLNASVTADLLSCRYGPGPEYLYLFALKAGANIKLMGRVDAENWDWVWVENQVPCWVKASFLSVQGDIKSLPAVYPGPAKLPITPYYHRSEVLSAKRDPLTNKITISWVEVPVNLGDYEDNTMQTYIVELWRCQDGQLVFDPQGTRLTYLTFLDEPGCSAPSHGRVWVQEKHGYAGPAEIPWPE